MHGVMLSPSAILEQAINLDEDFRARYDAWTRARKATWAQVREQWLEEATRIVESAALMRETIGEFLEVKQWPDISRRKTHRWAVLNREAGNLLGVISWYGAWRQYTYNPEPGTVYSAGCLRDIAEVIERKNADHKQQLKNARGRKG